VGTPDSVLEVTAHAQKTKSRKRYLWWAAAGVVVIGLSLGTLIVGAIAFLGAGTSLTRKDFATEASARAFVDEHLPAPLPASVIVHGLNYDRFTDWRLEARLTFPDRASLEVFLEQTRVARQLDVNYCGNTEEDAGLGDTVPYYLPKVSACGSIHRGPHPTEVLVECNTR
jgi:hypothetical protein